MITVFLSVVVLACWAATATASIKLYRLRKAANNAAGWHVKRTTLRWAWLGNAGYMVSILLTVVFFAINQTALGLAALVGGIALIFVFVLAAGEAAGQGEGAN